MPVVSASSRCISMHEVKYSLAPLSTLSASTLGPSHRSARKSDRRIGSAIVTCKRHARRPYQPFQCAAQVTGPPTTAALIDQLRADGVVLTYDPQHRTLRADSYQALSVTIGKDH